LVRLTDSRDTWIDSSHTKAFYTNVLYRHTHTYIYELSLAVDNAVTVIKEQQNNGKGKLSAIILLTTRNQHPVSKDVRQQWTVAGNSDRSQCWWFSIRSVSQCSRDLFFEPEI